MARECLFNIIVDEQADLFKSAPETIETKNENADAVKIVGNPLTAAKDYTYAIAKGMLSFIS
jgi:hypothetical protein